MSLHYKQIHQLSLPQSYILSKHTYISKKIVLITNIPNYLFKKDILYQKKFLGKYGRIRQMILMINQNNENNAITQFDTINQAALAILSLHNFKIDNYIINSFYYIYHFCNNILNNSNYKEINCLFIGNININDFSLFEIKNTNNFDSFKFALKILNVEKSFFDIIYNKSIGNNYYELYKKFPKLTMKKLKNKDYINSLNEYKNNDNYLNKKKEKIISDLNKNNIDSLKKKKTKISIDENQKSTSDSNSDSEKKLSNKLNFMFEKRKFSRFDFVNNKINNSLSVVIPDYFLDFIDKIITLLYIDKKGNNNDKKMNYLYINDFNCNWTELINKLINDNLIQ